MARILITGCSTGIGRASAIELTKRGHEVIATARRVDTLRDLDVAEKLALDVADEASVLEVTGGVGQLDALVNNAGVGLAGPIENVPLPDVQRAFDTNVFGAVRMIQAVVPRMAVGSGVIVNVTSVSGKVSGPLSGYYAATKHALEAISDALHYETGHFGLRVVVIEPGAIETNFTANETLRRRRRAACGMARMCRRWAARPCRAPSSLPRRSVMPSRTPPVPCAWRWEPTPRW